MFLLLPCVHNCQWSGFRVLTNAVISNSRAWYYIHALFLCTISVLKKNAFLIPWRPNVLNKCLSPLCAHNEKEALSSQRWRCVFQADSDLQKPDVCRRQDSKKIVWVFYLCRFTIVALDYCPTRSPVINLKRPFCLNVASLGSVEPWYHCLVLVFIVWGCLQLYSTFPPSLAFGKGRWYNSQSGSSIELANLPNERSAAELQHVTRYVLGEWIHFLIKPSAFVGIWRWRRIFSCLFSFLSFFFTLLPFPLLVHVPGLCTALLSDYSASGLITINEGLRIRQ